MAAEILDGTPVVFIVQKQMRFDEDKAELVPKFNVEPARVFGEFRYLLSPTASPFNPEPIIDDLHEKLQGFADEDSILLLGNPALIGWACSIAAYYNKGRVATLQWSGKDRRYIRVVAELNPK